MPIYAYKCSSCGFAKDTLQKMSDPPLTVCPNCGAGTFDKQVTAAGFQLKGSGWYVTDFRDGSKKSGDGSDKSDGAPAAPAAKPAGDGTAPAAAPAPSGTAPASTPAPAPAAVPVAAPPAASRGD